MYTPIDLKAVGTKLGYIKLPDGPSSGLVEGGYIPFQFMPRVTSDQNTGQFQTDVIPNQTNDLAIYMGGRSRAIQISTEYIVDGEKWTIPKIKNILKALRGYYINARLGNTVSTASSLVCKLVLWEIGGRSPITCRLEKLEIKYTGGWLTGKYRGMTGGAGGGAESLDKPPGFAESEEIRSQYYEDQQAASDHADLMSSMFFPLKTELTLGVNLWTNDGSAVPIEIGIDREVTLEWY